MEPLKLPNPFGTSGSQAIYLPTIILCLGDHLENSLALLQPKGIRTNNAESFPNRLSICVMVREPINGSHGAPSCLVKMY